MPPHRGSLLRREWSLRREIAFADRPTFRGGRQFAAILDAIDTGTPAGLRDQALLLLAYKTGRRGREIAGSNLQDVREAPSSDPEAAPLGLRVTFRTSKTNPQLVYSPGRPPGTA